MIGYIFLTENIAKDKKFIGKYASVKYDAKYIGDDIELLKDLQQGGPGVFRTRMLRACETLRELEQTYEKYLDEYNARTDGSYYNYVVDELEKREKSKDESKKAKEKVDDVPKKDDMSKETGEKPSEERAEGKAPANKSVKKTTAKKSVKKEEKKDE